MFERANEFLIFIVLILDKISDTTFPYVLEDALIICGN